MRRWWWGGGESGLPRVAATKSQPRATRHSSGLAEFMRRITGDEKMCILDLGQTSHINIPYFTQRGARVYNEDILGSLQEKSYMVRDEDGVQRLFTNRHIENLFAGFSSVKFFLGRDNVREVLVVR